VSPAARAQQQPPPPRPYFEFRVVKPVTDEADPKDVASADAIVAALYDVISGPAGQARNWDRFRSLFIAGARLIPTGVGPDGKSRIRTMTPDEYATATGARLEQSGFFEKEVARTGETFGSITHAFSTYESRHSASDEKPFARGINSIQLYNDGTRWWVVTVYWDSERAGNPIPQVYLQKPEHQFDSATIDRLCVRPDLVRTGIAACVLKDQSPPLRFAPVKPPPR
jgi:hypothetical protein